MMMKLMGGEAAVMMVTAAMVMAAAAAAVAPLVTFVFGDSLTEVGNNNHLQLSLAKANYPYYGIDFDGGKVTGRFTNGRTIGDIICKYISLNSYLTQKME